MEGIGISIISITFLILLLVIGMVLLFFISGKQKMQQRMELIETRLAFEQELRQVEAEVSEQILKQLGRELHDNIGQKISALGMGMEKICLDVPAVSDKMASLKVYLDTTQEDLRLLRKGLDHEHLMQQGIIKSISQEVERIQRLQLLRIHWEAPQEPVPLNRNEQLVLFRMFQEIIQNSLKHAQAKNIYIKFSIKEKTIRLCIRDDGRGFDLDNTLSQPSGAGLKNMKERSMLIHLKLQIKTAPGKGCEICIHNIQENEDQE